MYHKTEAYREGVSDDENEFSGEVYTLAYEMTKAAICKQIADDPKTSQSCALRIGLTAAAGALHAVASLLGRGLNEPSKDVIAKLKDRNDAKAAEEIAHKRVHPDSTLMSALALANIFPGTGDDMMFKCDYGPHTLCQAIYDFKTLRGRDPKGIDPSFMTSVTKSLEPFKGNIEEYRKAHVGAYGGIPTPNEPRKLH